MAISISNFCVALKDANSCNIPIQIAEKLQAYFRSKVVVYLNGEERGGIPPGFAIETLASVKDIAKAFVASESDLVLLPLTMTDPNLGLVTPQEANKLIDHIERMVLTIPCNKGGYNFSKIIVPIDTSFETRQKVPYAISMAKAFGGAIYVLGVSNDKSKDSEVLINNYIRQVTNNIEEKGVSVFSELRLGGNPTQQVLEYSVEINGGMIVIMTEQEANLTSFFSGKYSQQMVKNSTIPVLSIHPKDLIVSEARL
ncbi:MAG: universal stress protein [Bacteroidia bacterium]|nr:universal stress protein [Bacteroidia bacterium]MCF8426294.1 universal stress protein [Bacteroidia bacterium]MCF8446570.1 universal stress protein [Bacteroidia bacterium]